MNNRNPEFNQTLVIEVCLTIYKWCINKLDHGHCVFGDVRLNVRLKRLQKVNKEELLQSSHPRGPQLTLTVLDWDVTNHRRPIATATLPLVGDGQVRTKKLELSCTSFWGCLFGWKHHIETLIFWWNTTLHLEEIKQKRFKIGNHPENTPYQQHPKGGGSIRYRLI